MIVYEQGISTKSFIISMVSSALGIGSMIWFLSFTEGKGLVVQLICVAITMLLLLVGGAAWMGLFDKKEPVVFDKLPGVEPVEEEPKPKVIKQVGAKEWADNYLKEKGI